MDAFLVMVTEKVWERLTSDELDTAFKLLHGRMLAKAPEPYQGPYGTVPSWGLEIAEKQLKGFLELDAGPKGEHVVTLFDLEDRELMEQSPRERLARHDLRQIVWLRTVN